MDINAVEYDKIAKEIFAPVYPVIADQIKEYTGIKDGICLDVGTGTGYLGINMAKITNLQVYLLDNLRDMLEIANNNIILEKLENKVKTLFGDVHNIPLKSQSINLVISRGSLFFWEDKKQALKEIYRILAIDGIAYIGGGFGNRKIKSDIDNKMERINKNWKNEVEDRIGKMNIQKLKQIIEESNIPDYRIFDGEEGMWIVIRRENNAV